MFKLRNDLLPHNPAHLHYGVAVADLEGDGRFSIVVAGYGAPNRVLRFDGRHLIDTADTTLADAGRRAIGLAAADIDGDGREELYVLNTDTFGGAKTTADRLFQYRDGKWIDAFSLPHNEGARNLTAGRSVCAVDRHGEGRYGFFVANYGGPMRLYELVRNGVEKLVDVAPRAGLALITGGRGVVSLPLVSDRMDIFCGNENGPNFLFKNLGNGKFAEIAADVGLEDEGESVRGVTVLDLNDDGRLDLAYGNWEGPHRLMERRGERFTDTAAGNLAGRSRVRTLIAADFDNDGHEELFFNNIGEPNRLFTRRGGAWADVPCGDALEPHGMGTGAAVADFDGDGRLELIVAHGESLPQPLSVFKSAAAGDNGWLRIAPRTRFGAPARGAIVTLVRTGGRQVRAIDAGSGYLCQMEPVAHFGLGPVYDRPERVEIVWPDGAKAVLDHPEPCRTITVPYPGSGR